MDATAAATVWGGCSLPVLSYHVYYSELMAQPSFYSMQCWPISSMHAVAVESGHIGNNGDRAGIGIQWWTAAAAAAARALRWSTISIEWREFYSTQYSILTTKQVVLVVSSATAAMAHARYFFGSFCWMASCTFCCGCWRSGHSTLMLFICRVLHVCGTAETVSYTHMYAEWLTKWMMGYFFCMHIVHAV